MVLGHYAQEHIVHFYLVYPSNDGVLHPEEILQIHI